MAFQESADEQSAERGPGRRSATTLPGETAKNVSAVKSSRLTSIDAYRGFVMLLMASEGLGFARVAAKFPENKFWHFLAYQTEHVEWLGCTLWDLIQPSFMFLVGVVLPFSIANRIAKNESFRRLLGHAIWRSFLLIALGIFLRSIGHKQTYFTFEDVLTQIGLGYTFLFLFAWTRPRTQFIAAILILIFYWAAFALYPQPPPDFDYAKVGVPADWPHLQGFAAHWDKNVNFAATADQWFLNLFPRESPFIFNGGGYLTLNFVPALATMIFGLLAGELLRSQKTPIEKVLRLFIAGIFCLALGKILDVTGICPSVKKIWTPAWTIFSTGWTCLFLAGFYAIIDLKGWKRWAFPLVVVGMNSIAMYVIAHIFLPGFILQSVKINFGQNIFVNTAGLYAPILERTVILFGLWLVTFWMYRRKIFLKI